MSSWGLGFAQEFLVSSDGGIVSEFWALTKELFCIAVSLEVSYPMIADITFGCASFRKKEERVAMSGGWDGWPAIAGEMPKGQCRDGGS